MFDKLNDILEFCDELIEQMKISKKTELFDKLINWRSVFFTTSSELLGEFRVILEEVVKVNGLSRDCIVKTEQCIEDINRAFDNT